MEIQESKSVSVSNISPSADEKTVSDFFSFCGKITKLYLKRDEAPAETSSAIVQFETESAAKTALLLTNALIIDRPITVLPYSQTTSDSYSASSNQPQSTLTPVPEAKITTREFNVPDEQRTKTSVIASLLAAGYVLTNDAFDKAKEVDEKHMISLQAKIALEQVKVKAHEIDKQLGLSEKAATLQNLASEKVKQIDEQLHISEKAKEAANTVKTTATNVAKQVSENPTISKGVTTVKDTATNIKTSVSNVFNDYKEQTQKAIEEKQKEKLHKQQNLIEGAPPSNDATQLTQNETPTQSTDVPPVDSAQNP